jgi:PHP family Zn ribbon phosphoesterase
MTDVARESLKVYVADLHVHTVLSPCADTEMIPPLIVERALQQGVHLIAITDHNASANVSAVQKAAAGTSLVVLPGMELQTYEEVHLLCLFDTLQQLDDWQAKVDAHLPAQENVPEVFGEQFVVDETAGFIQRETRLLATSVDMRLEDAVTEIVRRGGIAIPAHVDRPVYSLFANLGFVPHDVPIDALELSPHVTPLTARSRFPDWASFPLIRSGDTHHLDGFSATTVFTLAAPTTFEIRLALLNQGGRTCSIVGR